jgi:hypothetical protein
MKSVNGPPIQISAHVVFHSLPRSTCQWHMFASNFEVDKQTRCGRIQEIGVLEAGIHISPDRHFDIRQQYDAVSTALVREALVDGDRDVVAEARHVDSERLRMVVSI